MAILFRYLLLMMLCFSSSAYAEEVEIPNYIGNFSIDKINQPDSKGHSALQYASSRGDIALVKKLVRHGANINYQDKDGFTPLLVSGSASVFQFLLKNDADIHAVSEKGLNALMVAVTKGDLNSTKALIDAGLRVGSKDHWGWSPLLLAVEQGDLELIEYLLDHGGDVSITNNGGWGVLEVATRNNHLDVFNFFKQKYFRNTVSDEQLDKLLNISSEHGSLDMLNVLMTTKISKDKKTDLFLLALKEGQLSIVEYFVEGGQDPEQRFTEYFLQTPLTVAAQHGHHDVVRYLIEQKVDINRPDDYAPALLYAVGNDHLDVAETLMKGGANPNIKTKAGDYFLHVILRTISPSPIKQAEFLLNNGCNPDLLDSAGKSPIYYLSWGGRTDLMRLLLSHGAKVGYDDVDIARSHHHADAVAMLLKHVDLTKEELTRLLVDEVSRNTGTMDVVNVLVDNGSNINAIHGVKSNTLPMLAASYKNVDLVRGLRKLGVDLLAKNANGETVLFHAIHPVWQDETTNLEMVQYLISNGVDVNAQNLDGETPLMRAVENEFKGNDVAVISFMLDSGADILAKDNKGMTVFGHFSVISGNIDVLELLLGEFIKKEGIQHKAFISSAIERAKRNNALPLINAFKKYGLL
jgi:ankyrin repeat protein